MQVGDNIAGGIKPGNGGALLVIDQERALLVAACAERSGKVGSNLATERGIKHVEVDTLAAA